MFNILKQNLLSEHFWLRTLFMVIYFFVMKLSVFLLSVLIILQYIYCLFHNNPHQGLQDLSGSLTKYIHHIYLFLIYKSEDKPFPFQDWPQPPV